MFLKIKYPGSRIYSFILPFFVSSIFLCFVAIFPDDIKISGDNSLFDVLASALPISGGFFVASLTVLVSQSHAILLGKMVGTNKPSLKGEDEPLTRQRFLALLFGYLSFSSFAILGIISGADIFRELFERHVQYDIYLTCKMTTIFILVFWTTQMSVMALIGLHYLSDRLYRSDQISKFGSELPPAE